MRAWIVDNPRGIEDHPLVERALPIPAPGRGEVRLRVLACGICHTDLHLAEGDLPPRAPGIVPGHQIVGRVDAIGLGVDAVRAGEIVGVTWLAGTCGECEHCYADRENLCESAAFTGWDRHGGFAEYTLARADFLVPLPVELEPVAAAPLLCAGVIGYRALRRSGVRPGERLGLVGFGASARLALQVAKNQGCDVHVFTRGESNRRAAREMGADWVGGLESEGEAGCHSQILFAPSGALVPACLRHLRPGGTLAINAVHLTDIPGIEYGDLFGEKTITSVSHLTRRDATRFLEIAAEIPVRTDVTTFPFEQANEALRRIKEAQVDGQAVLEIP